VSTVAVATHGAAGSNVMNKLAVDTGGEYYQVNSGRGLPRIFQREARRVAQPLIYRNETGFRPLLKHIHEITAGIDEPLPEITGYVMTTLKDNSLVEVPLVSPQPKNEKNATILAVWPYGLGKAVAYTTDVGARWATSWTGWQNYDKLLSQMIRWSMRPVDEGGKFTVATDVVDDEVRVVVTALDKNDEFLNFRNVSATVVGPEPELKTFALKLEQTAPGRYLGTFPATDSGSHLITINPGAGDPPVRTGVDIPYSDEFRNLAPNQSLLSQLAETEPRGGGPGELVQSPTGLDDIDQLLQMNHFRHDLPKATSRQEIWYYVVLISSCLFFFDVFLRRVQVSFVWVPRLVGRVRDALLGREPETDEPETIDRLRSRKAEVGTEIDKLRAGTRFEPDTEARTDVGVLDELNKPSGSPEARTSLAPDQEEETYTERLLRAKKKAQDEQRRQEPR
jgi:hypothetical protein